MSPLNNWDWQIGWLRGKLEQLVKWPNFHPSRIISSLKNKKNLHQGAGIGRNYWGLCVNLVFFLSLHRIRETNLKPKEMHLSFILLYYCIQFQFEVFNGDLKPGLVFDERVITTVLASTAVWTSACSAVILTGSYSWSVSRTSLCVKCVCGAKLYIDFGIHQIFLLLRSFRSYWQNPLLLLTAHWTCANKEMPLNEACHRHK